MKLMLLTAVFWVAVYKLITFTGPTTPLVLTVHQAVGMAPLTLRVKVRAADAGREVCVIVDGPETFRSCRTLDNVTWTQDFTLRTGGDYAVYATTGKYQTPDVSVKVIGLQDDQP